MNRESQVMDAVRASVWNAMLTAVVVVKVQNLRWPKSCSCLTYPRHDALADHEQALLECEKSSLPERTDHGV